MSVAVYVAVCVCTCMCGAGVVIRAGGLCGWSDAVLHRPAGALPAPAHQHTPLLHVPVYQHHRPGHVPPLPAAAPACARRRRAGLHHLQNMLGQPHAPTPLRLPRPFPSPPLSALGFPPPPPPLFLLLSNPPLCTLSGIPSLKGKPAALCQRLACCCWHTISNQNNQQPELSVESMYHWLASPCGAPINCWMLAKHLSIQYMHSMASHHVLQGIVCLPSKLHVTTMEISQST